jgi:hypothetical protein
VDISGDAAVAVDLQSVYVAFRAAQAQPAFLSSLPSPVTILLKTQFL